MTYDSKAEGAKHSGIERAFGRWPWLVKAMRPDHRYFPRVQRLRWRIIPDHIYMPHASLSTYQRRLREKTSPRRRD